jgi:hypothetical protein
MRRGHAMADGAMLLFVCERALNLSLADADARAMKHMILASSSPRSSTWHW